MSYLALDIGNVLFHLNFNAFLKSLSKTLNISVDDAMYFMNRTQKLHDLGYTAMSDELRDHFKIHSDVIIDELIHIWDNTVTPCWESIDKFNNLVKTNNIQVALVSNIGVEHASSIKNKLKDSEFFNNSIKHFSCDVGARKPSMLYYQSFLMQYPEFKGCVYVDDLQENLDASKKFGFQTFKLALSDYYPQGVSLSSSEQLVSDVTFGMKFNELENLIKSKN